VDDAKIGDFLHDEDIQIVLAYLEEDQKLAPQSIIVGQSDNGKIGKENTTEVCVLATSNQIVTFARFNWREISHSRA